MFSKHHIMWDTSKAFARLVGWVIGWVSAHTHLPILECFYFILNYHSEVKAYKNLKDMLN